AGGGVGVKFGWTPRGPGTAAAQPRRRRPDTTETREAPMLRRMFAFAAIAYLAVSASLAARSQVPGSAPAAEAAAAPAPPARDSSAARPSMPPPGSPGANPPAMRAAMAPPDSFAAERDSLMNDV